MSKLIVYLAFIIYCGRAANQRNRMAAADLIIDHKADKLWDDGIIMETKQVEESTLMNYDTMEDGRLFILDEKSLLLMANTVNLIKWK
ncbi:unnamed protein product [Brugia pahangi]|uniref:Bulb-type lectin domain-containing protein n=1 Tax=Brugia pahangi TaxID=6280 RepID=A0A0N4TB96_BRUPA|nr:unnamed protein product [Brugia pahangi]